MKEKKIVQYKFYSSIISDILKTLNCGALTGAYILSFCCIDYMGLAINPDKKNVKTDFINFIEQYLGRINKNYQLYASQLYAIRCSLVHTYGPSNATQELDFMPHLMFHTTSYLHLRMENEEGENILYVVLSDFISDLITSITIFFDEISNPEHFEIWNGKLFYDTGLESVIKLNELRDTNSFQFYKIHPILEAIDNQSGYESIRQQLYCSIKKEIKHHIYNI